MKISKRAKKQFRILVWNGNCRLPKFFWLFFSGIFMSRRNSYWTTVHFGDAHFSPRTARTMEAEREHECLTIDPFRPLLLHFFDRFFIIKHEAIPEEQKRWRRVFWSFVIVSWAFLWTFFWYFYVFFEEKRGRLRKNNQSITVRKKSYWEASSNKEADFERNYWRQFLDCLFHTQTLQTISLALGLSTRSDAYKRL